MSQRSSLAAAALACALMLVPAASALAEPTITSPAMNAKVPPSFQVTGTGDAASGQPIDLRVSQNLPEIDRRFSATVNPDGTWSVDVDGLKTGHWEVLACQTDPETTNVYCSSPPTEIDVTTTTQSTPTAVSISAPKGTVQDLAGGKLKLPVSCPRGCSGKVTVSVTNDVARQLGIPFWASHPVIGFADDEVRSGAIRLAYPEMTQTGKYDVGQYLNTSLTLPLFKSLPVTIKAHLVWGGGSADKTVSTTLGWPKTFSATGRGTGGMIGRISGAKRVSLGTKTAVFKFRLSNVTDDLLFVTIRTAGGAMALQGKYHLYGRSTSGLGATGTYSNGVFTLKVPIAGGGGDGARQRAAAAKIAPMKAFLQLAIGDKFGKGRRDAAAYSFQFTK